MKEPRDFTEFEIQAYLYSSLRGLAINVRGEVTFRSERKQTRIDLGEFVDGRLVGIIEVKNHTGGISKDHWLSTRQGRRYSSFGVPIIVVCGMYEAMKLVRKCALDKKVPWDGA